ncbi:hypothetical protein DUI87_09768 [Hirundo rustica rustica]|uniref:Uncharacterized protein n=1 Tax=Hirundo rustica rustica TaxID=333673 RepID=A0A3M0KYQ4_HIRRU|nr:hypothetical protein DUI87_09768 [Hirundo rustica rustica]
MEPLPRRDGGGPQAGSDEPESIIINNFNVAANSHSMLASSMGQGNQRLTAIFRRSHLNAAASVGEFSVQPLSVPPLISPLGRHPGSFSSGSDPKVRSSGAN